MRDNKASWAPWIILAATLSGPTLALATGFGGTDAPTRIPLPAKVFDATVEDVSGTSVTVTRISFNGEISLYGTVGEGQVAIPFEKIAEVRVEPWNEPAHRAAMVKLRTGEVIRVVMESDIPCYGDTSWGHYRIDIEKVRKVVFAAGTGG